MIHVEKKALSSWCVCDCREHGLSQVCQQLPWPLWAGLPHGEAVGTRPSQLTQRHPSGKSRWGVLHPRVNHGASFRLLCQESGAVKEKLCWSCQRHIPPWRVEITALLESRREPGTEGDNHWKGEKGLGLAEPAGLGLHLVLNDGDSVSSSQESRISTKHSWASSLVQLRVRALSMCVRGVGRSPLSTAGPSQLRSAPWCPWQHWPFSPSPSGHLWVKGPDSGCRRQIHAGAERTEGTGVWALTLAPVWAPELPLHAVLLERLGAVCSVSLTSKLLWLGGFWWEMLLMFTERLLVAPPCCLCWFEDCFASKSKLFFNIVS